MGFFIVRENAAPHPSPLPREREPICMLFKSKFDLISQAAVTMKNNSVSSLSLWERVRVRGFSPFTSVQAE
ncbi:hypothetical protein PS732_04286 [Pseudomonas fluorescens]|jgi:hypothetical protein|uniref:Uncharacterized protein n=1 Tax=Pseudomonas fluorescens TaxID=294 RepID=A0ABD7VKL5_PSEFL|nr:hypothetical protein PS732_04286 [Pseudomonas fluorescens]